LSGTSAAAGAKGSRYRGAAASAKHNILLLAHPAPEVILVPFLADGTQMMNVVVNQDFHFGFLDTRESITGRQFLISELKSFSTFSPKAAFWLGQAPIPPHRENPKPRCAAQNESK
jgi:hypothetical protein